jgi:hypothetical protein
MSKLAWIVVFAALSAAPAAAQSAIPDVRGTWKGESESIILGPGNPHHAAPPSTEPRLDNVPFTMTIDKQDGRRSPKCDGRHSARLRDLRWWWSRRAGRFHQAKPLPIRNTPEGTAELSPATCGALGKKSPCIAAFVHVPEAASAAFNAPTKNSFATLAVARVDLRQRCAPSGRRNQVPLRQNDLTSATKYPHFAALTCEPRCRLPRARARS